MIVFFSVAGLVFSSHAYAAAGFVQAASSTAYGNSVTVNMQGNVTAGNILAVYGGEYNATITAITATCTTGNLPVLSNITDGGMAYGIVSSSGPCSVTITFSTSSNIFGAVHEVSGIDTTNPVDATSSKNYNFASGLWSSGTSTTQYNGDYIFGATSNTNGQRPTAGSGFTARSTAAYGISEDQIQNTAGPVSAVVNLSNPATGNMVMAAFKAAVSGPPDTTPPTVPTGLTITGTTDTTISLSWTASTDPDSAVAGYDVYRNGTQVGTTAGATYTDTGLTASTAYTYTVAAYDPSGNLSAQSVGVNATTQLPPLTCSPANQSVLTGQAASFAASGGTGSYAWTASNGSPATGGGSSFSTSYAASGNYTVTVTSGAASVNCGVAVTSAGSSGNELWSGILNPTSGAGACNPTSTSTPGRCAIDWSTAGIPGGIPSGSWTQSGATIQASTYSNGSSDATAGIQAALNSCGTNHYIQLSAGTFLLNGGLSIPSNCALRGMGANQTILNSMNTNSPPVTMGSGGPNCGTWSNGACSFPSKVSITGGYTAGSNAITVSSASGISVGMYLVIDQINDGTFVTNYGGQGPCSYCDGGETSDGTRVQGQMAEVTSVIGNTIGITPALYVDYTRTPIAIPFSARKYSGLENLQIYANNTHTGGDASNIRVDGCAYCWVSGVEGNYSDGDHVRVYYDFHNEVVNSYFSNDYDHGPGAYDADIVLALKSTGNLIQNNILERLHSSVMLEFGTAGNVIAYNYTLGDFDNGAPTWVMIELSTHGGHPQFNLYEGNVGSTLNPDSIWGSSANNTAFRNWLMGTTKACNPMTGRGTVTCSPMGTQGAPGVNGWWETAGSADITITYLSNDWNLIGNILGSTAQTNLETNIAQVMAVCGTAPCGPNSRSTIQTYGYTWGYMTAGDGGGQSGDSLTPYLSALVHGNYSNITGATTWANGITQALPPSFYLSTKPSWWANGMPWPAIGPDVTGGTGPGGHVYSVNAANAAQYCYTQVMGGTDGTGSPLNFNAAACYSGGSSDTTPPTTSITAPTTGSTVSSTISVSASASDNVGVVKVEFYLDNVLQSTDTASPYTWSWNTTGAANGTHSLQTKAYDAAGNVGTSASVSVTVNNASAPTPPAITSSLTSNGTVGTSFSYEITGTNSPTSYNATSLPAGLSVNTSSGLITGTPTIQGTTNVTISATNAGGTGSATLVITVASAGSTADTTPPSVPTGLTQGSVTTSTASFSWSASTDPTVSGQTTSGLAGYKVYRGGVQVATTTGTGTSYADTNLAPATAYSYTVAAYDNAGNVSSQSSALQITTQASGGGGGGDTTPPTISLTAPTNNATVQDTVTVSASASDNVGVTSVQFYLDGTAFGPALTAPPYQIYWNTLQSNNGSHTLTARAYDAAGNSTNASNISVTVQNMPQISLTSPTPGSLLQGTIQMTALASSSGGNPTVQFYLDGTSFGPSLTAPPYQVYWNTTQSTNGSHTVQVRATDAAQNATTTAPITVTVQNTASLIASIAVNPSSGNAPLAVSLTGTAGGTEQGTINFTFYCNNNDSTTTITAGYDLKVNGTSTNPYSATNLCFYASPGTYYPKIIIEQGTGVDEARGTVTVTQASSGGGSSGGGGGGGGSSGGGGGGGGGYVGSTGFSASGGNSGSFTLSLRVTTTTPTTAQIKVDTSYPAITQLFYGTVPTYGQTTNQSPSLMTSYFNLTNLSAQTPYYLKAVSLQNGQTISATTTFTPGIGMGQTLLASSIYHYPLFTRNLGQGSEGQDVMNLQELLNQLGYQIAPTGVGSPGHETTYFGGLTTHAVQLYQCAEGIVCQGSPGTTGYGAVGPRTRAALNALLGGTGAGASTGVSAQGSGTSTGSGTITRSLAQGDQGADVAALQQFLEDQGYLPVPPTGYFGILTLHAVQAYQCAENIVCEGTPDTTGYGLVGPKTKGRMGE